MNTPIRNDKFSKGSGKGSGTGKTAKPKGRMLDPVALREVEALLGDMPRRRDLLIEALHRIGASLHLDRMALWLPDAQGDLTCGPQWSHPAVPAIAAGL